MSAPAGAVRERPILFSGPMVRAIIEGRKTQTRRVAKPQPTRAGWNEGHFEKGEYWNGWPTSSPYGVSGDRLWVRETFCIIDDRPLGGERWVDYRATPRYSAIAPAGWENDPGDCDALKWKPSIFMPRSACRIVLEITNVRVERLQSISIADIEAEGIDCGPYPRSSAPQVSARESYQYLWDSLNRKRGFGWSVNPWVFVVEFKAVTP